MAINFQPAPSKKFEINLLVRDSEGKPTGTRKSYSTDDSFKLWQFYMRHQGRPKKKRSKKEKEQAAKVLPKQQDAVNILKALYQQSRDKLTSKTVEPLDTE